MRSDVNPDAVIKTVELMTLLTKAELRINPRTRFFFPETRQCLYIQEGNIKLSNIDKICKQ